MFLLINCPILNINKKHLNKPIKERWLCLMVNIKDIPELEKYLAGIEEGPGKELTIQDYTGPAVGLMWDADAKKLVIADGWAPDVNGNILNIEQSTGPATGMVLKDGVITPVK